MLALASAGGGSLACGEDTCAGAPCLAGIAGTTEKIDLRTAATGLVVITASDGEALLVGVRAGSRHVSVIDARRSVTRALEGGATAITSGDVDGDGVIEIAIATDDPLAIEVYTLSDDRLLEREATLPIAEAVREMRAVDLDGDGEAELVTAEAFAGLFVRRVDGTSQAVASRGAPNRLRLGDLDGDGAPELVAIDFLSGDLLVHRGDSAGGFGSPIVYNVDPALTDLALGDADGDGDLDVAVSGVSFAVKLLTNDGSSALSEAFVLLDSMRS